MAKVKMKATTEDFEKGSQDQCDFVTPAPGYYILQLQEVNAGFSIDQKTGEEDKKRPRLECIWKVTGVGTEDIEPTDNYGNVWDYISFSAESGFSRGRFLRATGVAKGNEDFDGEIEIEEGQPGTIIGVKVLARLKNQRGRKTSDNPNPTPRAKIASMLPYAERNTIGEGGEAFAGVSEDDVDSGTSEDTGSDDPYTEAELDAMEPKELGGVARDDFNLDPNELLVKVRGKVNVDKSKAKLIEAILEAQNAEDGSGDDAEGDNPF